VLVRGHDNLMLALSVDVQPHADVRQAERVNGVIYTNGYAADDMTRLKGIGPNYQQQLAQAGIRSYADLARADETYLQSRLGHAALRQAHRYNWQGQARLAAIGDEVGLVALKAKLPLANGKG
jgi:small subunit ribosomal protein S2